MYVIAYILVGKLTFIKTYLRAVAISTFIYKFKYHFSDSDCDLEKSYSDSWLEGSSKRTEISDPDFKLDLEENDALTVNVLKFWNPSNQKMYPVYESCLEELMRYCLTLLAMDYFSQPNHGGEAPGLPPPLNNF